MSDRNDNSNIEKFYGNFSVEESGCSILINSTINFINDLDTLGLYTYLASRPPGWIINAKQLRSHFNISKDKIYKLLTNLKKLNLLSSKEIREKGQFKKYEYKLHLKPFPCPEKPDSIPCPEKPDTEKPDTYKEKNNIEIKESSLSISEYELEKNLYINSDQQKQACILRKQCLENKKCQDKYEQLPEEIKIEKSFIETIDECVSYYATQLKPQLVHPHRLISWINREIRKFNEENSNTNRFKTYEHKTTDKNNNALDMFAVYNAMDN